MIPAVLIFCTGLLLLVFFWPLGLVVTAIGGAWLVLILLNRMARATRAAVDTAADERIARENAPDAVSPRPTKAAERRLDPRAERARIDRLETTHKILGLERPLAFLALTIRDRARDHRGAEFVLARAPRLEPVERLPLGELARVGARQQLAHRHAEHEREPEIEPARRAAG